MAYRPMSRPESFDPPGPSDAPISMDAEDHLPLAELATALAANGGGALSAELALDLVLNEIVEHARLATGATGAAIALTRDNEIVCRATTGNNAPGLGVRLEANSGLSGACVKSKKWQRCDDTETDPRVNAEVCRGLGIRSILVFPVIREDELLGVFEIFSPRPKAFSDREFQTLEGLSRNSVTNVDRVADALAAPAPLPPPSASSTEPPATAGELETVDQLEVYPASVDSEPVKLVHTDVPAAVAEYPAETVAPSRIQPRDRWMGFLTLTVIALALFLGWMMGYVRRARAPVGAKASVSASGVTAKSNSRPGINSSSNAASSNPDHSTVPSPATAPITAQKSGTQASASTVPPVGSLVVYDNGKVIFQSPPQTSSQTKGAARRPVKVPSQLADEYLLQRVEPEYPEAARQQHIQGPVVLEALVGKDGTVEKLSTISGDSQLSAAATDAVRQWRFKPFFKNGSPEEFRTQITVSFRLP